MIKYFIFGIVIVLYGAGTYALIMYLYVQLDLQRGGMKLIGGAVILVSFIVGKYILKLFNIKLDD